MASVLGDSFFNPMTFGVLLVSDSIKSAGIAYAHYLSFMLCFAALVLERRLLKIELSRIETIILVVTDVVYGIAALTVLITGVLRVLYFGQGYEFYIHNPVFWFKVGIFVAVGALSLYPTVTYILWALPLRNRTLPVIKENLLDRLSLIVNIEIAGFAAIPLFASLMSRGVGLH